MEIVVRSVYMDACHHLCLEMHIAEKTFVEQNVITDSISNI